MSASPKEKHPRRFRLEAVNGRTGQHLEWLEQMVGYPQTTARAAAEAYARNHGCQVLIHEVLPNGRTVLLWSVEYIR